MNIQLDVKPFQETLNASMCGPASLKIVLDYYNVHKSEEDLAILTETDRSLGTSDEQIKLAAEKLGFKVEVRDYCDFSDIEKWITQNVPVIVDWFTRGRDDYDEEIASADGHYSVVTGLDDKYIYLQDPEIGKMRKMEKEVFMRVWFDFTGEYIAPDELIIRQLIAIYR